MGEIFIEREGYTTGGNSFCYLNITKVNNEYLAGVIHVGKYPLYDINIKLRNLNKEYSSAQEPMTYIKIGDLSANIVKKLNNLSQDNDPDEVIKYEIQIYSR